MKITSVDVIECKPNVMGSVICVRINTDEGISGYGEVGLSYGKAHHAGVGIARDFGQLIIGMDPRNIEAIWSIYSGQPSGAWAAVPLSTRA